MGYLGAPPSGSAQTSGASSTAGSKENLLTGSSVSLENEEGVREEREGGKGEAKREGRREETGEEGGRKEEAEGEEDTSSTSPESVSIGSPSEEPNSGNTSFSSLPASGVVAAGRGRAKGEGQQQDMSWWAEALAETDTMTGDLDEVVERKGVERGRRREVEGTDGGKKAVGRVASNPMGRSCKYMCIVMCMYC